MSRYKWEFDSVSNSVGRFGYKVIDTENFDNIVAHCEFSHYAELVVNALNVNNKPSDYGLKLVTGEDE